MISFTASLEIQLNPDMRDIGLIGDIGGWW